ncbi:MAG: DUF4234 domain-containing protein [Candidatus Fimenecus sp.]
MDQNNYQNGFQQPQGYAPPPPPPPYQPSNAPVGQLKTDRNFWLWFFLSGITLGIYPIVLFSGISTDINTIASRYDGKKTMHFCLMAFVLSGITLGIYPLVWYHGLSSRIEGELKRRNIVYDFGAKDFWLWACLGSLIGVGPMIYTYKLFKAMNMLSEHYNQFG